MKARSRLKEVDSFPVQFELLPGVGSAPRAKPFLKWAGGKAQLLPQLVQRTPESFKRYFEPFVGGGALFFRIAPQSAYLSDSNQDLINAYIVVRDRVKDLLKDLRRHSHSPEYYYELRDADRKTSFQRWGPVRKASRLIYLNKTCYNGLYRVNSLGQFNVPYGDYRNPKWIDAENLCRCSETLRAVNIATEPFEEALKRPRKGDFVYLDPPYAPLSATSNFTSYSKEGFSGEDQHRLMQCCKALNSRGVKFLLSNSAAPLILELYSDFRIELVKGTRSINSKGNRRGRIDELIIGNY